MWPGNPLNEFDFMEFSNGSVLVRKVRQDFEGMYFCTAVNSGGFSLRMFQVEVGGNYLCFHCYRLFSCRSRSGC